MSDPKKAFWAKCGECDHIWIAHYLPMELHKAAKILGALHCPMCGVDASEITPAKQDDGELKETMSA